ncbi:hypothetical protein ccbrp13_01560 [Ktedonobacteria bacterium brp13]|nr:hypothetical protein ccbrp13_01560 [Ktedonobacteria bacterium brp13]
MSFMPLPIHQPTCAGTHYQFFARVTANAISSNAGDNVVTLAYDSSQGNSNYLNLDEIMAIPQ